jgi:hypothetical protein
MRANVDALLRAMRTFPAGAADGEALAALERHNELMKLIHHLMATSSAMPIWLCCLTGDIYVSQGSHEGIGKDARSTQATLHALLLLSSLPFSNSLVLQHLHTDGYSASRGCLPHRPWVLYLAALRVWSYGHALEGPLTPAEITAAPSTLKQVQDDKDKFLQRLSNDSKPETLPSMRGHKHCVGLLMFSMTYREANRHNTPPAGHPLPSVKLASQTTLTRPLTSFGTAGKTFCARPPANADAEHGILSD